MELREELQVTHPAIEADLERRSWEYVKKLLGNETRENREAYENAKRQIISRMKEKKEYRIPRGKYLFSSTPHLTYPQAEEAGILAEGIVVFGVKEYKARETYEQYLMHLIQIATMNAVRDYMQEVLFPQLYQYKKKEQAPYVSDFYGPGLFEEPISSMRNMVELTEVENITVSKERDLLIPDMSFAGVLYITKSPVRKEVPCISCKAKSGCEYCMKKR